MGVDKADWIWHVRKDGRRDKQYRHFCDRCSLDKGYLHFCTLNGVNSADRPCRNCSSQQAGIASRGRVPPNKGVPMSESTRLKLRNFNLGRSPSNKGVPLSDESRKKISCSVRGIGISEFDDFGWKKEANRKQNFNIALRHECFKLADYTCDLCNQRGVELNAHHLYDYVNHPHLLNEISNLVCLCSGCHTAFHKRYGRTQRNKVVKNTKEQYLEFKENQNGQ